MVGLLDRMGVAAARRGWLVVAAWLVVAVVLGVAGQAGGGGFVDDYTAPGSESQRAVDLLTERFPQMAGTEARVVFHRPDGQVRDRPAAAGIAATLAVIARQPHVVAVEDPLAVGGGAVSRDRRTAVATVRYDVTMDQLHELGSTAYQRLEDAAAAARQAGVRVEFSGMVVELATEPEVGALELAGVGVALVVLLVAFGSLLAAAVPVVVAVAGLAAGLAAVMLAASGVDIPTFAPVVAVMLGLGAGIDYALFVVTRYREFLSQGLGVAEAAGRATATAGHAVVFAGGTVVVAILGLWLVGLPFVGAMGLAAAIVVAVVVAAAVTLLPAVLGLLGHRIDRRRLAWPPRRSRHRNPAISRAGFVERVTRQPWRWLLAGMLVLAVLALPVFSLRLGTPDSGNLPPSLTQRRAYDLLTAGFGPGVNGPLLVAVERPASGDPALAGRLAATIAADPGVASVTSPLHSPSGGAAVLTVIPTTAPQDQATTALVQRLRERVIPAARGGDPGQAYVGGLTATVIDLSDQIARRLAWFITAVVGISLLLLIVLFRSLLVPLKAALLNIASISAGYGVVVAVFQWGWGNHLVGVDQPVPVISFVPMLMFAVLFGLSMDYEVFLLSRVREAYQASGDNRHAVVAGIGATARVITAAALIMVCVFLGFVAYDDVVVKMVGLGLAVAVAVDATIARLILVPATMRLLGTANWWLPAWLDRPLPGRPPTPPAPPAAPHPTPQPTAPKVTSSADPNT
jgi:putative drug exporter of the RND superfamily